jgi:rod shape-determining protein MreB
VTQLPEKIKKEIGTAIPSTNNTFLMKGRDIRSGTPKEIELTEKDALRGFNANIKSNIRWN